MEEADPRGSGSVILIGLLFGPFVLMLWLGRGRLAVWYLLAQLIFASIILLPGDRIQLRDGIVYLNGEALELARVQDIPCFDGERCNFFRETLPGGRSYVINNAEPNGPADNIPEYVVPAGHYFMLGDNRDNSLDSRYAQNAPGGGVGFVPLENLIGPVVVIFWNSFGITIDDRLQGYPTK